eukprot:scpid94121/ scgid28606/ 
MSTVSSVDESCDGAFHGMPGSEGTYPPVPIAHSTGLHSTAPRTRPQQVHTAGTDASQGAARTRPSSVAMMTEESGRESPGKADQSHWEGVAPPRPAHMPVQCSEEKPNIPGASMVADSVHQAELYQKPFTVMNPNVKVQPQDVHVHASSTAAPNVPYQRPLSDTGASRLQAYTSSVSQESASMDDLSASASSVCIQGRTQLRLQVVQAGPVDDSGIEGGTDSGTERENGDQARRQRRPKRRSPGGSSPRYRDSLSELETLSASATALDHLASLPAPPTDAPFAGTGTAAGADAAGSVGSAA